MPADIHAAVLALKSKPGVENPWALANWMKAKGKGYFAHGEQDIDRAIRQYKEARRQYLKFSENANRIKGVEIFAIGTHRGKSYDESDLDELAENFNKFSTGDQALFHVPAVLGHEEEQQKLEESDLPAAAWAYKVYREGPILKADLEDVPANIAQLIKTRRYRKVSAELYDEPPEGIPGDGKMLRRIAFLGGEIPQVKGLRDIPMPEQHSERGAVVLKFSESRRSSRGTTLVFAEVEPLDRKGMLEKLAKAGFNTEDVTDEVPDSFLAEVLRSLDDGYDPTEEESDMPVDPHLGTARKEVRGGPPESGESGDAPRQYADASPSPSPSPIVASPGNTSINPSPSPNYHADMPYEDTNPSPESIKSAEHAFAEFERDPYSVTEDKRPMMGEHAHKLSSHFKKMAEKYAAHARKFGHRSHQYDEVPIAQPGRSYNETDDIPPRPDEHPVPTTPGSVPNPESVGLSRRGIEGGDVERLPEQKPSSITVKYAELERKHRTLEDATRRWQAFAEKRVREEKRQFLSSKVDTLVKEGKVLPAEIDAGLFDDLMAADHNHVRKFAEGAGRYSEMTQLEHQLRTLDRRPVLVKFSERIKPNKLPAGGQGEVDIERFAEEHKDDLAKADMTPADMIKVYKAAKPEERAAFIKDIARAS